MLERHQHWRRALNEVLEQNANRPFKWGEWDCCIGLMVECVKAMTGVEHLQEFRGKYSSPEEGWPLLKELYGFTTTEELMTSIFGEPAHIAFARTGDVVSYKGCIGIFKDGRGLFIGCEYMGDQYSQDGLVSVPREDLEACWHV